MTVAARIASTTGRTVNAWVESSQPADRWLAGFAAACAIALAVELSWPHPLESNAPLSARDAERTTAAVRPPREAALSGDYRPIVDRPLFTMNRRPYEPPVEAPPQVPTPPAPRGPRIEFELSAVIQTPSAQIALLETNRSPELHKLSLGQGIEGWTLTEITAEAAVLRNGNETVTVKLWPHAKTTSSVVASRRP